MVQGTFWQDLFLDGSFGRALKRQESQDSFSKRQRETWSPAATPGECFTRGARDSREATGISSQEPGGGGGGDRPATREEISSSPGMLQRPLCSARPALQSQWAEPPTVWDRAGKRLPGPPDGRAQGHSSATLLKPPTPSVGPPPSVVPWEGGTAGI